MPTTRIAFAILRRDPLDNRLNRQAESLTRQGYEVAVFPLFRDSARRIGQARAAALQFAAYRLSAWRLRAALRAFAPDLIIVHEPEALGAAAPYAQRAATPLIYDAHEYFADQREADTARREWVYKTHRAALPVLSALTTVSPGLVRLYKEELPDLDRAPILLPNANLAPPAFDYDGRLHRAIGVPRSQKLLVYHGGLWAKRGLDFMINLQAHLGPDWSTVFIGFGPFSKQIPDQPGLHLLPPKPLEELYHWTAGAHFAVIPYPDNSLNHRFCLPNKLWEYAGAGTPILLRRLEDLADVFQKWDLGLIAEQDAPLAQVAARLKNVSPAEHNQYRQQARRFAQQEGWPKYEQTFLELVDELYRKS